MGISLCRLPSGYLFFLTIFLSLQFRNRESGAWRLLAGLTIVLTAAIAWADSSRYNYCSLPQSLWRAVQTVPANARCLALAVSGDEFVSRQFERDMGKVRTAYPLPPTDGSVDAYPSDILVVLANRLRWRPRPSLISNMGYTPALSALDVERLRSPRAPSRVLFSIAPVDDQFAPLEDGASWPELWSRYEIDATLTDRLWLKRSTNPRTCTIKPLGDVVAAFGHRIQVPDSGDSAIWASIDIDPSLVGHAADVLFKSPPPYLRVFVAGGAVARGKLPRGMARSGFLLSPLIDNSAAFADFTSTQWRDRLKGQFVRELTVETPAPGDARTYYDSKIVVHFSAIDFPRHDPGLQGRH